MCPILEGTIAWVVLRTVLTGEAQRMYSCYQSTLVVMVEPNRHWLKDSAPGTELSALTLPL